ncbi:sulfotransferase family protein [Sphaerisporangium aureirubrum]|uniref:Sulfotransferase family protein n=1 Tax=Sphaerisporangium aureirubrum TaxID=1544736 RepID=A0ABW1NI94_9ACTN
MKQNGGAVMQVIGAGFGRTGTFSLKAALERLGFAPCYHMKEVLDHPAMIYQWLDIAEGRSTDFDAVFDGYAATVDWPAAAYWRELIEYYPDAKVLLTVRDPERWYESMRATILSRAHHGPGLRNRLFTTLLRLRGSDMYAFIRMTRVAVSEKVFGGSATDRETLIKAFHAHVREVRETVPADRLLVYEVKQGWEPLCAFLGVPVPDEPFPWLNDRDDFRRSTREFRKHAVWRRSAPRKALAKG